MAANTSTYVFVITEDAAAEGGTTKAVRRTIDSAKEFVTAHVTPYVDGKVQITNADVKRNRLWFTDTYTDDERRDCVMVIEKVKIGD